MPKVTVLMPVYNGEKYLKEAIDSILTQTFKDLEFLIINDGSTDDTANIIESYKDQRIRLIHNESNIRLIGTLNRGLKLSTGKYIARMDCDDISLPKRLEKQVEFMDAHPDIGVCGVWFEFIGFEQKVMWPVDHESIAVQLLYNTAIGHPTAMMRSSLVRDHNLSYDLNYPHCEDYALWIEFSKVSRLANLPEVLLKYRAHPDQISVSHSTDQEGTVLSIRKRQLSSLGISLNDNDMRLYVDMFLNRCISRSDYERAKAILEHISAANHVCKVYNEKTLDALVQGHIKRLSDPLVSVVVPCYNHARFIGEAIESILNQSYANWECIVVDDGSIDNTRDVVEGYASKDNRIRYIYQINQGLSSARNAGIMNSKGNFVQLLDADDMIATSKLDEQISAFKANPDKHIVYSDYNCFDNDDRTKVWKYSRVQFQTQPLYDFALNWEKGLSIPIHCFMFKKACFDDWGAFDRSLVNGKEDWDLHLKFAIANASYLFVSGITSYYRVSADSMARDLAKMKSGMLMLFRKYIFGKNIPLKIRMIFIHRYLQNCRFKRAYEKIYNLLVKYISLPQIVEGKRPTNH